jgi:hypothetical protein
MEAFLWSEHADDADLADIHYLFYIPYKNKKSFCVNPSHPCSLKISVNQSNQRHLRATYHLRAL